MKFETISKQTVRTEPWWLALLPFVALAVISPTAIPLDDAYITLHNARVLLSGEPDPVYGASYLAGATSLVHLALVAVASALADPVKGSVFLGLCGAALYIAGLVLLADRCGLTGLRMAAVVLIGAFAGHPLGLYANGLETSLAMAVVTWLLVWCDDRHKLAVLAGIAPFVRPELGLLSVLLICRLGWTLPIREKVQLVGIAALVAAPWLLWSLLETGHLIPSTIGAKRAFFRWPDITLGHRLQVTFFSYWNANQLPLLLGLVGLARVRAGWAAAAFVLAGMGSAFVLMPDLPNWNLGRYSAIYFPVFVLGIAGIASERSRVSDALLVGLLAWNLVTAIEPTGDAYRRLRVDDIEGSARFIATLPASSVVLVHDAGQVAWAKPKARLVDMVGLKTPAVVPIHERLTPANCQFDRSLDAIVRTYRVTHVAVGNFSTLPCIAAGLRRAGWVLQPVYEKDFFTVYAVKRETP